MRRVPKFEGPEVAGTAQVLSVQPIISTANWGSGVACRIGLRVAVPGHPPYDATVKTPIPHAMFYALYGSTVAVEVDSANLQKVRFDPSQPILQAGSSASPSPTAGSMSYGEQPPLNQPPLTPGPPNGHSLSYANYMPPGMGWLPIASACVLGIGTLAGFAYQAHALLGISLYMIVPIALFLLFITPVAYLAYRRSRAATQPPQAESSGWSGPTTGSMSYREHAPLDAPPPRSASPYDSLSPGMRTYVRVMWGLVGFGFVAALVVLGVVMISVWY